MSKQPTRRERTGIALLGALTVLALLGLLTAGAFTVAMLDRRSSRVAQTDAELTTAADVALHTVLSGSDSFHLAELRTGETRTDSIVVGDGRSARSAVSVSSLPDGVLWLVADVASVASDGHRRVSLVARFPLAAFLPRAALTSRGGVQLGPGVRFGVDRTSGGACPQAAAPDVILGPGAELTQSGGASPEVLVDHRTIAADSTRYLLGLDSATLRGSHITYVRGDTTIDGGSGHGILVVRGRVRIAGSFVFSGLLIAGRGIDATGGGIVVHGALMAFTDSPETTGVRVTDATLVYAPCIVLRALNIAHAPRPTAERSWADVY